MKVRLVFIALWTFFVTSCATEVNHRHEQDHVLLLLSHSQMAFDRGTVTIYQSGVATTTHGSTTYPTSVAERIQLTETNVKDIKEVLSEARLDLVAAEATGWLCLSGTVDAPLFNIAGGFDTVPWRVTTADEVCGTDAERRFLEVWNKVAEATGFELYEFET
jgi:hypothetical protein